jgi:hypothetical protein
VSNPHDDPVYQAVALLSRCRHQLPPDVLRSLASIWVCGSAARFQAPHEEFWSDRELFTEHDVHTCERGDVPWHP